MRRMIVIAFFQQLTVLSSAFMQLHDPANAITWKNLSPVSREPGWLRSNVIAELIFVRLTNVPRSRQTDTSPAHVIRP